jgi:plasmid maintenance system antidote protein VapI
MDQPASSTLGDFLAERRFPFDAAAILAEVDTSTVSRIVGGQVRARPTTIVRLARGLGVSARRMERMCQASWDAAHTMGASR